jgi:ABC-2 type transport system permease protein
MTTLSIPLTRNKAAEVVADAVTMTKRNLIHIPRVPELLFFSTIQPIMFVLLFSVVFGGAFKIPGMGSGGYREYIMAGIFVQTVAFSSGSTAVGLAEDLQRGLMDRFRSLPMFRGAVLMGRTFADLVRMTFVMFIMVITGLIAGWRIRDGIPSALAGFALILFFAYAMCWLAATIGLSVGNAETANTAAFVWLFPVTFLSNAFAPVGSLPEWAQQVAIWNPVSSTVQGSRDLFGNPQLAFSHPDAFPVQHPIITSVFWSILLLAIFVPWSVRKFSRVASN